MLNNSSEAYQEPQVEAAGLRRVPRDEPGAGVQLFVINLCASLAPVATSGRNLPGLENYRLYQVAHMEDGRTRHRLRLGFFTSETHAGNVLAMVRQQYPTAFIACLQEEDRRFTRGYLPPAGRTSMVQPAARSVAPAGAAAVLAGPTMAKAALPDAPQPAAPPPPEGGAAVQQLPLAANSAGLEAGNQSQGSLAGGPGPGIAPAAAPRTGWQSLPDAAGGAALPEIVASPAPALASVTVLPTPARRPAAARPMHRPVPQLDSTQTIRALTLAELDDEGRDKWFAIQLAASEQPVNLDTMPHLDIFDAYRLYSVACTAAGRITHSLRLGFFKEDVSAEAVSGYLKTFFSAPAVLRVSEAEYDRFKEPRPRSSQEPEPLGRESAGASGAGIPTITMEVPAPQRLPAAMGALPAQPGERSRAVPGTLGMDHAASARPGSQSSPGTAPPARRQPASLRARSGATGKHKALAPRSLAQELLEEARAVALSESGIREVPRNNSLLSRLVGKLTR